MPRYLAKHDLGLSVKVFLNWLLYHGLSKADYPPQLGGPHPIG